MCNEQEMSTCSPVYCPGLLLFLRSVMFLGVNAALLILSLRWSIAQMLSAGLWILWHKAAHSNLLVLHLQQEVLTV